MEVLSGVRGELRGMVTQELAVTSPERVERLALACTSAGGEGGSSYPLEKLLQLPPEERIAAGLKVVDRRWDEHWLDDHPADRALAERLAARQLNPAPTAAHRAQLEAREGHDVWDRLSAITCPTLVGYGNYDGIAPAQNSAAIASRIQKAELNATKADTDSCSRTRPPCRRSCNFFKPHQAKGPLGGWETFQRPLTAA